MLWSDPLDEPPEEIRTAQTKLDRLGWVLAVVITVVLLLLLGLLDS